MKRLIMLAAVLLVSVSASATVKTLKGQVGKEVHISVEGNPSTGYSWMLKNLPQQLVFVSSEYQQSKDCKTGMVGCAGTQNFVFIAQKPGKGELTLTHGRVWDNKSWQDSVILVDIRK